MPTAARRSSRGSGLEAAADADLVAIPASDAAFHPSEAVKQVVRDAVERGAWVLSVCSGAFTLGAAGVLDGRECTTHWRHSEDLAAAYPLAKVNPDVLYAHDGTVITSAGTAAGVDACLHLVRAEHGGAVANRIARRMVVSPHRDGGQRQFIDRPVPVTEADSLGPVLQWMLEHLDQPHTVEQLARRAAMSGRTFARRFVAETGTTPHQWITDQRVLRARELLEETDLSIEQVARDVGLRQRGPAAPPLRPVHRPDAHRLPDAPPLPGLSRGAARPWCFASAEVVGNLPVSRRRRGHFGAFGTWHITDAERLPDPSTA